MHTTNYSVRLFTRERQLTENSCVANSRRSETIFRQRVNVKNRELSRNMTRWFSLIFMSAICNFFPQLKILGRSADPPYPAFPSPWPIGVGAAINSTALQSFHFEISYTRWSSEATVKCAAQCFRQNILRPSFSTRKTLRPVENHKEAGDKKGGNRPGQHFRWGAAL